MIFDGIKSRPRNVRVCVCMFLYVCTVRMDIGSDRMVVFADFCLHNAHIKHGNNKLIISAKLVEYMTCIENKHHAIVIGTLEAV